MKKNEDFKAMVKENERDLEERARSYLKKEGYDPDCVDAFLLNRCVDGFCFDDGKIDYNGLIDAYCYWRI